MRNQLRTRNVRSLQNRFEQLEHRRLMTWWNSLSSETGGTESVSSTSWMAADFTPTEAASSLSATLLLSQNGSTTAQPVLKLYSDSSDGLTPGDLIGVFTAQAQVDSTLKQIQFSVDSVSLSANQDYWLVLSTSTGQVNWAWTSDFTVQNDWASSEDSGSLWFSSTAFPPQYSIGAAEAPAVSVSIADLQVAEAAGTAAVTVSLSSTTTQPVTVQYTTRSNTATSGVDFVNTSGSMVIPAGQLSSTININIVDDLIDELDESFFVDITGAVNASVADNESVVTIADDDPVPSLTLSSAFAAEDAGAITFTLSLNRASSKDVVVALSTADESAQSTSDYSSLTTSVTILAGQTSATFQVAVSDDSLDEPNENFLVNIDSVQNATATASQAVGTIVNDDGAFPWQWQLDPLDVNANGLVTAVDALLVINYMNSNQARLLPLDGSISPPPYYDVNGNGLVTPVDALLVINYLNTRSSSEGESALSSHEQLIWAVDLEQMNLLRSSLDN